MSSVLLQVTAILVLFGLPYLLTGSILAHECMHAWLRLNGVNHLSLDIEEGLCQLMALLWLEAQDLSKHQVSLLCETLWMAAACPEPLPRPGHAVPVHISL